MLLEQARSLLDRPDHATEGRWPRAAALLTRQALEAWLADSVESWQPGMAGCSMRAKLLCLEQCLASLQAARSVGATYAALSRACHHHAYELAPTREELLGWLEDVERLLDANPAAA